MEFSIDKQKFLYALGLNRLALPTKTPIQIHKSVLFTVTDRMLEMRSTDDESYIITRIPVNMKNEGICAVDGLLLDIAPKFGEGEIKFKLANDKLTISQAKRKHTFATLNADDFPTSIEVTGYKEVEVTKLREALSKVYFTTKTADKEVLKGFNFCSEMVVSEEGEILEERENYLIAGDGARLVKICNFEVPLQAEEKDYPNPRDGKITRKKEITIKAKPVYDVLSYLKDLNNIEVSFNSNMSGIKGSTADNMSFEAIFTVLKDQYEGGANKAAKVYSTMSHRLRVVLNKSELQNSLDLCSVYSRQVASNDPNYFVTISKNDNGLILTMKSDDKNADEHIEAIECEGEEVEQLFNPVYLQECISQVSSDSVEIRFFEKQESAIPIVILDPKNKDFICLQVETRLNRK